ncbi:hypothetical protein NX059_000383 [Plenodomus lindquistii]|nr:hypothetical protein NX059_000383 [Plenodomus lindquistii]
MRHERNNISRLFKEARLNLLSVEMRIVTILPILFGALSSAILVYTEFPHLLIPLQQSLPNTHFGTKFDASISYSNTTGLSSNVEISFDVPDNEATTCRINFLINTNATKNAPRLLTGTAPYTFSASRLTPTINKDTDTWNSHPNITDYVGTYVLTEQGQVSAAYTKWFACPKGQIAQFLLYSEGPREFGYYWYELDYKKEEGGPHGVVLEMHA